MLLTFQIYNNNSYYSNHVISWITTIREQVILNQPWKKEPNQFVFFQLANENCMLLVHLSFTLKKKQTNPKQIWACFRTFEHNSEKPWNSANLHLLQVQSNKDGCQYAVKRSAYRFRGNSERNRSVREARNHERLCPHPHILNLVAAWEECGRLYIQTELCSTTLLLHAETQSPGPGSSRIYCNIGLIMFFPIFGKLPGLPFY